MTFGWARSIALFLSVVAVEAGGQVEPIQTGGPAHVLVSATGGVTFKREGWTQFAPAKFGVILRRGDLLRLTAGASARIVCADLSSRVVSNAGITGVPCAETQPLLAYKGSLLMPTRGDGSEGTPIVVTPRRTKILDTQPVIRWVPPAGVTTGVVTISGPGVSWTRTVTDTTVPYPADAPGLMRGRTYRVVVAAGGRSSDEDGQAGTGFSPALDDEVAPIAAARQAIQRLGVPREPTALLIARLYASKGFFADAIGQLEELATRSDEPVFSRELAGCYVSVGLNRLAVDLYARAFDLAHRQNDLEAEAAIQYAKGILYDEAFGNPQRANNELMAAARLFEDLGDTATVKLIRQRIAEK